MSQQGDTNRQVMWLSSSQRDNLQAHLSGTNHASLFQRQGRSFWERSRRQLFLQTQVLRFGKVQIQ